MNTNAVEQLKAMTNKEFARALTGIGIMGFPDDIWAVDKSDIYDLLEYRTNSYNIKKVGNLLSVFKQMEEYLKEVKERVEYLREEIKENRAIIANKYADFENGWEDYSEGKISQPSPKADEEYYDLCGFIEDAEDEISNINYKQELYYYAVVVLEQQQLQNTLLLKNKTPQKKKEGLSDIITTKERRCLEKAIARGWMVEISEGQYEWRGLNGNKERGYLQQLAFFCGYMYRVGDWTMKVGEANMPTKELGKIFGDKNISKRLNKLKIDRLPKWSYPIKELINSVEAS